MIDLARGNWLDRPVNEESDHILGRNDAPITLVEYGSYACPYCRAANERIAEVRDQFGDRLRYVFRHKPLAGNPLARPAADLVERARDAKSFWSAHVRLMTRSEVLTADDLATVAADLGVGQDDPEDEARALVLDGFKMMLKQRDVYFLSFVLFIGSGIVNAVFTLIDGLGKEKGLTTEQGVTLTIVLLVAGIIGSIVLPVFSDAVRQRKTIILLGIFGAVPSTLCLAMGTGFNFEAVCFFVLGFCVTGVTPVAYQYGAEITHPAPEGASNGLFALVVQASGLLIVLMDGLKSSFHNSYVPSIAGLAVMIAASGLLFLLAKESPEMHRRRAQDAAPVNAAVGPLD